MGFQLNYYYPTTVVWNVIQKICMPFSLGISLLQSAGSFYGVPDAFTGYHNVVFYIMQLATSFLYSQNYLNVYCNFVRQYDGTSQIIAISAAVLREFGLIVYCIIGNFNNYRCSSDSIVHE